ncbi:hypothetical protein N781_09425 [Pontibacillus halophilus JSM 076056 = DSM 19796]|uniref:Uncharacterized protein n=1 Tax=Pontibacillus halophilus JSM 076056 = DSM 19796 TaxID=1385510 RepID=A0A0A5G840_9BACI|nr:hypothetical protein [Pontibacillus halophilus]KGX89306.1 hypothetical protein N781_09425 [Pontibacillus halophilus JSM 076056 = DSM 19796]
MMYSFPAILIYGGATSLLSDWIGRSISNKLEEEKLEILISATFHLLFGLILIPFSLVASILFFIIDRLLGRVQHRYTWKQAGMSFALVLILCLILWFVSIT